jgi:hypothetical protein
LIGRIYAQLYRWVPIPALRSFGAAISTLVVGVIAAALWWQNRQFADAAETTATQITSEHIFAWFFAAFVGLWGFALLSSLVDERPKLTWVSMMVRNPVHYGLIALLLLAIFSPFLGFGRVGRFANSGLTTSGNANNHFLIPQTALAHYEKDLVEITQSNDPYLQQVADESLRMTWFEFVNYVADRPDIGVGFVRGEDQFHVERVGDIEELSSKFSWWSRKVFSFDFVEHHLQKRMIAQP